VKTDRNDARGIAQLIRLGWFRPVHCKSLAAQEVRAVLTARKLTQIKLYDVENSLRGIFRSFGLKVGKTRIPRYADRIRTPVEGHPILETVAQALLRAHAALQAEFTAFDRRVDSMARRDAKAKLLMSTPGVGPIVALTYAAAIDDPRRFKSSKNTGAHFGLTPKIYESGESKRSGHISHFGDPTVRAALYEAAQIIMTKPIKGCPELKAWAWRIAERTGPRTAKVALARKLAVIMHRMLVDQTTFNPALAAKASRTAAAVREAGASKESELSRSSVEENRNAIVAEDSATAT